MFTSHQRLTYFEVFWNTCVFLSSVISKVKAQKPMAICGVVRLRQFKKSTCEHPQHPVNQQEVIICERETSEEKFQISLASLSEALGKAQDE